MAMWQLYYYETFLTLISTMISCMPISAKSYLLAHLSLDANNYGRNY